MTRQPNMAELLVAEAVGTFMLTGFGGAAGVGAAVAAGSAGVPAGVGLLVAALAHGLVLLVIVNTFGRISGAHVNPAVTISLASIGRFSWAQVPSYIIAQFVGAFVGALAIVGIYGQRAVDLANAAAPTLASGVSGVQGTLAEALGAFILILAVVATAADTRFKLPEGWAGLVIGFALAGGIFLAGVPSGAGLNPALGVSPYLVDALFKNATPFGEIPIYLIGPVIGGVVAAFLYRFVANMSGGPMTRTGASKRL